MCGYRAGECRVRKWKSGVEEVEALDPWTPEPLDPAPLDPGPWTLDPGPWTLDPRPWNPRPLTPDPEPWILNPGPWTLDPGPLRPHLDGRGGGQGVQAEVRQILHCVGGAPLGVGIYISGFGIAGLGFRV